MSVGSAWVACASPLRSRCCLSILCSSRGVGDHRVLLGLEQGEQCGLWILGSEPPPAAVGAAVEAEWHRGKGGRGTRRRTLHSIPVVLCVLPSAHCFYLVNQQNLCILLFQPAHQQSTAWLLLALQPWFSSVQKLCR